MSDELNKNQAKNQHENTEPEVDTDPGDDIDDVVFEDHIENTGADYKKKTDQLRGRLKDAEAKAATYLDNWQRDKAEFINIRKRDEAGQQEFLKFANEKLIADIIPVLDSFDMAIAHTTPEVAQGIEQTKNQLVSVLERNGVKKFSPIGQTFDPAQAQAIGVVPGDEDTVMEVIQPGYELNGKVVRPAMVKVGGGK